MKSVLTATVFFALALSILAVQNFYLKLDIARQTAYMAYEECVEREYNMSPSVYYQLMGEYPICENQTGK